MYSVKCGYRDSVARILTISEGGSQKLVNPVRCSEKVLNLEMRGGQSRDTEYRRGFVWNPGRRAKICGDYGISPIIKCTPALDCVSVCTHAYSRTVPAPVAY